MTTRRNAKLYQERKIPQDRTTRRKPLMRYDPGLNAVHTLPLHPPFPNPAIRHAEGGHPPDAGKTQLWPHGNQGTTP